MPIGQNLRNKFCKTVSQANGSVIRDFFEDLIFWGRALHVLDLGIGDCAGSSCRTDVEP
jgi:hypothetical protein